MAHTTITDLAHAPMEVIFAAVQERSPYTNSILNSAAVMKDPRWASRALEVGGTDVDLPVISPLPGGYTLQNPGTPATVDKLTSKRQTAPVLYREKPWGRDALAVAQSAVDPLNYIADQINAVRAYDAEATLVKILTGIFGTTAFLGLDVTTVNEDPTGDAASNAYWTADTFHDTVGILGIREDDLRGGVILMPPQLRTYLKKLDEIDYVKGSDGGAFMETYKGMRVHVDTRLTRAGTTSGTVYQAYICAPGSIVYSLAPQSADGTLASSLAFDADVPNLRKALYDRIVYLVHVNGAIWTPTGLTIAAAGPTDAQLATVNKWGTAFSSVNEHRIVRAEVNI